VISLKNWDRVGMLFQQMAHPLFDGVQSQRTRTKYRSYRSCLVSVKLNIYLNNTKKVIDVI
jgi:hypothetical protein